MNRHFTIFVFVGAAFLLSFLTGQSMRTDTAPGLGDYDLPFYPDGTYMAGVQSPDEFLGFVLGSKPVTHTQMLAYFEYLDNSFPNATLHDYGKTYEGRRLVYLTVTSRGNARKIARIRDDIAKLSDPRKLKGNSEADKIIARTPAVAWMAYAIHGDELSSTDAALQLAYQLVAGTDDASRKIRNELVVCIDPLQNADGRTRFLGQMEQWNTVVPSTDVQSLHHRGVWPWGRGNHYLFDLNRDWFVLVHPETRGKVKAFLGWHPQFMVDSHEMGALDTYLFNPPREPFNPFMPSQIHKWWKVFAEDQAAAFNRYGWSYYTREWNEELFPGYGSSWPIYQGAVGILYEQAGTDGSQVKRADGTVMTFRESVHHQFISSMANLTTAANHREELLRDYYETRLKAVGMGERKASKRQAFLLPPSSNESRLREFAETLQLQDIEVERAAESFKIRSAMSRDGEEVKEISFPEGTIIVRLDQPSRNLVEAVLTFDIRLSTDFLEKEKRSRLKHGETKLYEATGWSLALAYDLEAYFSQSVPTVKTVPFTVSQRTGGIIGGSPKFGYLFSGADDRSYIALVRLLERDVKVWCARKPFEVEGRKFPRGSFLIRLNANPELKESDLEAIAEEVGITLYGVNTALAAAGPDLGGNEFERLERPRIALVGGNPISFYSFGAMWHLLDSKMNMKVSLLDAVNLTNTDLHKYNVLVLPSVWGGAEVYKRVLGDGGIRRLKDWVRDGGTLVATGMAVAFLADTSVALSTVRQRRQVLGKLSEYDAALKLAREAEAPAVDSLEVWEGKEAEAKEAPKEGPTDLSALKTADEVARKLSPRGVIMLADLDEEHWLTFGCQSGVPVMVNTSYAYLTKKGVEVAARLADNERIRLSGLLWPEARQRWSETVYASRESNGKGQVILFATDPNFRAYFQGGNRMLLNALLLGPGFGTRQTVEW